MSWANVRRGSRSRDRRERLPRDSPRPWRRERAVEVSGCGDACPSRGRWTRRSCSDVHGDHGSRRVGAPSDQERAGDRGRHEDVRRGGGHGANALDPEHLCGRRQDPVLRPGRKTSRSCGRCDARDLHCPARHRPHLHSPGGQTRCMGVPGRPHDARSSINGDDRCAVRRPVGTSRFVGTNGPGRVETQRRAGSIGAGGATARRSVHTDALGGRMARRALMPRTGQSAGSSVVPRVVFSTPLIHRDRGRCRDRTRQEVQRHVLGRRHLVDDRPTTSLRRGRRGRTALDRLVIDPGRTEQVELMRSCVRRRGGARRKRIRRGRRSAEGGANEARHGGSGRGGW